VLVGSHRLDKRALSRLPRAKQARDSGFFKSFNELWADMARDLAHDKLGIDL